MSENKGDIISRSELSEEVQSLRMTVTGLRSGKGVLESYGKEYRESVLRLIDEAPAVDAQPVVHGEWMNIRYLHDDCYKADCSNCLETSIMDWGVPRAYYRYCRSCNAKMDGGDTHV